MDIIALAKEFGTELTVSNIGVPPEEELSEAELAAKTCTLPLIGV